MKKLFVVLLFSTIYFPSHSQLKSGNWIVGGTGSFLTTKNIYSSPSFSSKSDRIDIKVSPNIGYFIIDNFATGLRASFSKYKEQVITNGGLNSNVNRFEFGPFIRYYFLDSEKQYNILSDISYQFGFYKSKPTKGNITTLSASVGSVIFFNTSVGLEFLMGYYVRNEKVDENYETNQKGFQMVIGFQIHLEK